MKNYYSVGEISTELGISDKTIYKRAAELGFDTSKITEKRKEKLIQACKAVVDRKKEAKELLKAAENVKSDAISGQTGSTLEKRLEIAKKEFDNISKSLAECQIVIERKGTIMMNGNNGIVSSNPAVKTKCELLKQHNALQKTIQDLENTLKLTVSSDSGSAIDD